MTEYIVMAATAWFMGFFPLFEIYLAVPAAMGIGMNLVSAVWWAWLGNFIVIPFVSYAYDWLMRFQKINRYFTKLAQSKASAKIQKRGVMFVLLSTPLLGSWAVAVSGKLAGIEKKTLFTTSAISIAVYGSIIGVLTQLGIDSFS
ncbi:small multi-drug export protein [Lentibacillus salicampi]|uniref:Small multi-drug export protein n=1 Tax=Lentibacillus salicampi TaxID=175306 RepID=A0A4Y9AAX8_9BACI|nr:small multi-drug export protein [Lentibacillus salicampi]TFJ91501.1 hypothetical protein E4U82_17325 [Lentibacillus salicampi]